MQNKRKLAKPLSFTIRPTDSKNAKRGDANRCLLRSALRRYYPKTEIWVQIPRSDNGIIHIKPFGSFRKNYVIPAGVTSILRQWDNGAKPPTKPLRVRVTHEVI